MIIDGELNQYKVKWESSGWSYAVPIVKVKKKIPLLPFSVWRKVWEGSSVGIIEAEKKLPDDMKRWYQNAVDRYERYIKAWDGISA